MRPIPSTSLHSPDLFSSLAYYPLPIILLALLASRNAATSVEQPSRSQPSTGVLSPSSSLCLHVEKAFENVTEAGEEPPCRCHPSDFNKLGKNGVVVEDGSWIGCTRHKMPSVFRTLKSLDKETTVSHLWIWDALINILPSDFEFVNLRPRMVTIENSQLSVIRAGAFNSIGRGLTSLRLRNNILKTLDKHVFVVLEFLEELDLSGNKLSELRSGQFNHLRHLESLAISGNQLSRVDDGVFAGLRTLKKLMLDGNKLTKIGRNTFAGLDALEELSLRGNRLTTIEQGAFSHMRNLKSLDLGDNQLKTLELEDLPQLATLQLNSNNFDSLKSLKLSGLPFLRALNLDRNGLSELQDEDFSPLRISTRLTSLSLVANNISLIGCHTFESLPHLAVLSLQNNSLTTLSCPDSREPILMRSVFHPLKGLRALLLSRNRLNVVEDGHVNVLSALHELALDHNNISEVGKDALRGLTHLRKLFINDNRLYYLPEGIFSGWSMARIQAVDLSSNQWECICGREWIGEWLAKLAAVNTPSGTLGCLLHNGAPFSCSSTGDVNEGLEHNEQEGHNAWITVVASILAVTAILFLITAGYVYYTQENCYSLRTSLAAPSSAMLRNLPPDMIRLIPSQESLLLSYPNPIAPTKQEKQQGLLVKPQHQLPISAISISIDPQLGSEGTEKGGEPEQERRLLPKESHHQPAGERRRVRFDDAVC